ncbi:enhanced serine sensitivity protein SseB [Dickeya dadantii]|nr:enhanced serine sensitivity protein SseB [Dickeya dadantii]NAT76545.1 enhanced serine sensitivity protein SseB [Dickeya dadantii]NPE61174.1 enhanced serine sensitivity protein SseB [Dickeya dadantii]OOC15652.1 enhanced serine sensitivity protein SseB [Dickeya dadantii]UAY95288.1 enhanced serine sensitivity protein SseB [Dickeya dadantii]
MEFSPHNRLEELLKLAASEPAHRPEFFSELLEATVYVLGHSEEDDAFGESSLQAGSGLQLQHWEKPDGNSAVPFFSSLEALQLAVTDEQAFLALPVRTLFDITRGATLFLNPKLPYGKEFLPQEIEHLLSSEGSSLVQQHILDGGTELKIGIPAEMPAQMIDSLTQLFSKHRNVKRAFLAQIQEPDEDQPHLLIGLDADGDDLDALIQAAGSVATDTQPDDRPIDLCLVSNDQPGISHFLIRHTTPFYERKWGSFLREFKHSGQA